MPDDTASQPELPLAEVPPRNRRGGRPRGKYGKMPGSGRKRGTPNKSPQVAQALANKASPDAVRHLVKVMEFRRFEINGAYVWPTIHTATMAAMKILDIADMPAKEAALAALGAPVSVTINLTGSSAPRPIEPPAVTIDAEAVRIE